MPPPIPPQPFVPSRRIAILRGVLLAVWAAVSFGACFFARELAAFSMAGWPLHDWIAAQGALLVFIAVVVVYAAVMARWAPEDAHEDVPADVPGGSCD